MTDFILGLIPVGVWSLMLLYGLGFLWSRYDNIEDTDNYHDLLDIYVAIPVARFIFNPILHGVAMAAWVQYVFLIAGTVGGYFLGKHWWKVVYIQRRHWYFRMKDQNKNKELV